MTRDALEWHEGFPPYGHQAAAFRRLSSLGPDGGARRPQPTLVTTGTGSGKTEAFLYPILDHVLRAKRAGQGGIKAIILYPMNALANDQAKRLTELLTKHDALGGITAALYTGQGGPERSKVSAAGLITERSVIRDSPPDILLTNYKMLDQLLLRHADAKLWSASATSLQYLVLDEFHTYDGAQGTDVAMLIRRLGLALKTHWPTDAGERRSAGIGDDAEARPLGNVTPVATSATLGDKGDPSSMLDFARTVFGDEFDTGSVVTESRLSLREWVGDAVAVAESRRLESVELDNVVANALLVDYAKASEKAGPTGLNPDAITRLVLSHLYRTVGGSAALWDPAAQKPDLTRTPLADLLPLVKAHPLVRGTVTKPGLVALAEQAVDFTTLVSDALPPSSEPLWPATAASALSLVLSALSHLRKELGRGALSVDVHLWTRELTRLNRSATGLAQFTWQDDGVVTEPAEGETNEPRPFPALYCRHCGRSGWGITMAPTGADLDTNDVDIRGRHARGDERFRPLIHAPSEGERAEAGHPIENLWWFLVDERRLVAKPPSGEITDSAVLPVLTHRLDDAGGKPSKDDNCPSCGQKDGIRFLGSAIATLLSVALSSLFGTPGLDAAEKKALVFTDSVQDAAHRAGFVQARSHALTLRAVLRRAMSDQPVDLDELVTKVIEDAGDDPRRRYRLLPPELAERERFAKFWQEKSWAKVHYTVRRLVRRRLLLDVLMEHGLRSTVGRTLEATGAVVAEVRIERNVMLTAAQAAITEADSGQGVLAGFEPSERDLLGWVRGVLEHMRTRGAIQHEWFDRFREEDGIRWWITGGRRRHEGMPGFGKGQSAPGYPRVGGEASTKGAGEDLEPVGSARGWYAAWTHKALHVETNDGAVLARLLMKHLDRLGVVGTLRSKSGGITYHLAPSDVVVQAARPAALEHGDLCLECADCGSILPGTQTVIDQLDGGPCLVARCTGTLHRHPVADNFYRRMYEDSDPARVVAREHTSMLEDEVRLEYETAFKSTTPAANAPNVLVATPTLEMGIDIGDLSTVMLSSLPRSVASYLQRVGRAGRLTGNALAVAFVTARGDQLPRFADPTSVVNGAVRPPATYLDAEEILRRQYVASIADEIARTPDAPHPTRALDAVGSSEPGTFLGTLVDLSETAGPELLSRFLGGFENVSNTVKSRLRDWALPMIDDATGELVPSDLTRRVHAASMAWRNRMEVLARRETEIQNAINAEGGLRMKADSPAATDDDKRALRTALAALKLTQYQKGQGSSEHWVSVLEEYGLLPNYTLLDDSVTLEVSLSWVDPETQEFSSEHLELNRGSAQALRDFAPGSTFYARGYRIAIDALDLGRDDEAVRTWMCCPSCGFTQDVTDTIAGVEGAEPAVRACPRCGDDQIADAGQLVEVVELKRVSSVIRREEATIDDRTDERERERYTIRTLADVDTDAGNGSRWFVEDYGFGARYQRQMTIRWLNLGKSSSQGATIPLAGQAHDVALFRVCEECGKLDTSTGANKATEHRPWCSLRKATNEKVRTVALARSLTTEGLVLRLPESVTLGDDFSLPSLRAALMLALQIRIGGEPDHLSVVEVVDPSPEAGSTSNALLLHDVVRGGTGYLAELADPQAVWTMLYAAWQHLEDCACQLEGKLACERCLLPYAGTQNVAWVSRAAAARHLGAILAGKPSIAIGEAVPSSCTWRITQDEPAHVDPESHLELLFRQTLRSRLEKMGATIVEKPGPWGNTWSITMPGGAHWRLEPQVLVQEANTKPDFMLRSDRPGVPDTAIFVDGHRFHAMPGGMDRLADDARKRQALRDTGYQVLAFVWDDLDPERASTPVSVPWMHPDASAEILRSAGDSLSPSAIRLIQEPALELLLSWIQQPERTPREQLARWLPYWSAPLLQESGLISSDDTIAMITLDVVDGKPLPPGIRGGGVWSAGTLALGLRVFAGDVFEVAVVLDDQDAALGVDRKDAWREWLRLSNLLNFRGDIPTWIGTRSMLSGGEVVTTDAPTFEEAVEQTRVEQELDTRLSAATAGWREAVDLALDTERSLLVDILDLSGSGIEAPTLGDELGDGVPVPFLWHSRRVVVRPDELEPSELESLISDGWTVVEPNAADIRAALLATLEK